MAEITRLSLNQITVSSWSVSQAVEGCVRHGIPSIALWRHKIEEVGLASCVRSVKSTAAGRQKNLDDNYRAVDEAAMLGADSLVLVVGGGAEVGLADARKMVADGVAALVPYARRHGVKLGLEPLHPMYAAERSVLVTIGQALELASAFAPEEVGLILDVFHIWWDPQVLALIAQSRGRIYGFHVNDWLVPLPDLLLGRGMMGDGVIDNRMLRVAVDQAGYEGPIEVEIFNRILWDTDPDEVLRQMVDRFIAFV
jgi:sugar phosphate isomerase/epimerase